MMLLGKSAPLPGTLRHNIYVNLTRMLAKIGFKGGILYNVMSKVLTSSANLYHPNSRGELTLRYPLTHLKLEITP